jgi:hypothetical protein
VVLANVNSQVFWLFEVTGLDKLFTLHASVKSATENHAEARRLTTEGRPPD